MNLLIGIGIAILVWIALLTIIATPVSTYRSIWDSLTHARYRNDKHQLTMMLDHLRSFPDDWSVSRTQVSFPKEGAKSIFLTYDKPKDRWEYSLSSFGGDSRVLDGHFGSEFKQQIAIENSRRESVSVARTLFGTDGPLLLK